MITDEDLEDVKNAGKQSDAEELFVEEKFLKEQRSETDDEEQSDEDDALFDEDCL